MKVTEEGRRQPKCCLHPVQWYQPKIIADYISLFKFIYHIENGSYKTSALPHSLNPLRNFWCTPSLISHAPYGARQLPPGGSQGGLGEFAQGFSKPQVPTAKPLCDSPRAAWRRLLACMAPAHRTSQALWACQLPFQGRFGKKTFENPGFCGIMPLSLGALYSVETAARRQGRKRLRRGPEK